MDYKYQLESNLSVCDTVAISVAGLSFSEEGLRHAAQPLPEYEQL